MTYFDSQINRIGIEYHMSPNPRIHDPKYETISNLICLALGRAISCDRPNRLRPEELLSGQTDCVSLEPLLDVWNNINHRVFSRVLQTCLPKRELRQLSAKVKAASTHRQILEAVAELSDVPPSFLMPSFAYAEALREYALLENRHYVPKEFEIGAGYIFGNLRRVHAPHIRHWDDFVLEIFSSTLQVRLVSREPYHVERIPGAAGYYRANIFVV